MKLLLQICRKSSHKLCSNRITCPITHSNTPPPPMHTYTHSHTYTHIHINHNTLLVLIGNHWRLPMRSCQCCDRGFCHWSRTSKSLFPAPSKSSWLRLVESQSSRRRLVVLRVLLCVYVCVCECVIVCDY